MPKSPTTSTASTTDKATTHSSNDRNKMNPLLCHVARFTTDNPDEAKKGLSSEQIAVRDLIAVDAVLRAWKSEKRGNTGGYKKAWVEDCTDAEG
jgi:hypothetical protein